MEYTEEQKAAFRSSFVAKRRRQIIAAVPVVILMIGLAIAAEGESNTVFGAPISTLVPTMILFVIGIVIFSFRNWRCPACDKYLGKAMSPRFCSKCGVPLQ
jgi:hypothetical protein